jgi:hypothetical protein
VIAFFTTGMPHNTTVELKETETETEIETEIEIEIETETEIDAYIEIKRAET